MAVIPVPVPIVIPGGDGALSTGQLVFVIVASVTIICGLAGMITYWYFRG